MVILIMLSKSNLDSNAIIQLPSDSNLDSNLIVRLTAYTISQLQSTGNLLCIDNWSYFYDNQPFLIKQDRYGPVSRLL